MPAPSGPGCAALLKQRGTGVPVMLHSERVEVQTPRKARERENRGLRWESGVFQTLEWICLTVFIMHATKDGPEMLERWHS